MQIEGVFPHVEQQQRHDAEREVGLVVVHLEDQQLVAEGVPAEGCPSRTLHGGRGCVELSTELVERSEGVVEGGGGKVRRKASKEPNCLSTAAAANSPSGLSPPFGDKFFHQMVWLT